jgi:GTP cyclohydrolase I
VAGLDRRAKRYARSAAEFTVTVPPREYELPAGRPRTSSPPWAWTCAEGLEETPARMARAYAELFDAQPFRMTTFPSDEGYDELVLARAIPFRTVCEHHLLPFSGVAHVGYQVADSLAELLQLQGAGVAPEAEHTCMMAAGGVRFEAVVPAASGSAGRAESSPVS